MHKVIAIDGPSAAGKSTVAGLLACQLGFQHINSGAIYRSIAYYGISHLGSGFVNQRPTVAKYFAENPQSIQLKLDQKELKIHLLGQEMTTEILAKLASKNIGYVAEYAPFRKIVNRLLIRARNNFDVVIDGRDIGSSVFPDAWAKFFLSATLEIRTQRRAIEQGIAKDTAAYKNLMTEIAARDEKDQTRSLSPLTCPPDAVKIDSSNLTASQVVAKIIEQLPPA